MLKRRAEDVYKDSAFECGFVVFVEVVAGDTPLEFVMDDEFWFTDIACVSLDFAVDWLWTWLGISKASMTIPRHKVIIWLILLRAAAVSPWF